MENPADSNVLDADDASLAYIGQWRGLVSTTNWEKGRIIHEWREALVAANANSQDYSDEAWSRRVGNVTGQHVGRLRRVYERFERVRGQYAGLYWSHFQAAVEWPDAEMWLEGAVQSGWSINEMRARRWEALGVPVEERSREAPVVESELDEDVEQIDGGLSRVRDPAGEYDSEATSRSYENETDYGEEPSEGGASQAGVPFEVGAPSAATEAEPSVRPFEHLAELPEDLADAFEAYKLAILHHKLSGWKEISRGDVLASLDALKQLATTEA